MFKETRNTYSMMRSSGISIPGAILITAYLFVVMPFVELYMKYKYRKDVDFGKFEDLKSLNREDSNK